MLDTLAWVSIGVAVLCAFWIAVNEARHPQAMGVMNVVWPVTALYFSVFAVWAYYRVGRQRTTESMETMQSINSHASRGHAMHHGVSGHPGPTPMQVALGTSHCGAGCMLADVVSEFAIAGFGVTLLGSMLWAEYAIDFAAAWTLGIVFQYFAIRPMRKISAWQAIAAAIKADTLSIAAFQVGMYAWMALVYYKLFPQSHLTAFRPAYWLMMQVAMICGFATSYPMNSWLVRSGLKEAM